MSVSLRRSNNLGLPPAFGTLIEDEEDSWGVSDSFDRSPTPENFKNIADEDTWASLNSGHFNVDLLNERATSSAASEDSRSLLVSITSAFGLYYYILTSPQRLWLAC